MRSSLWVVFLSFLAALFPSSSHALTIIPAHAWSKGFGGTTATVKATGVALDGAGHVYVAGVFTGVADFGGGPLTSAGAYDVFLACFDVDGTHRWSKRFGDANQQECGTIAADPYGNVYVTGTFYGTINFGGGTLTSSGDADIFMARFDAAGTHQWSKSFGNIDVQIGSSVACDGVDGVYIAGYFSGTVNFGGSNLSRVGTFDGFLAKFNSAGVHQWSRSFGSVGSDMRPVVAANAGAVYLSGSLTGTVNFGGGNLSSAGLWDVFLIRFDPAGVHQWGNRFGGLDNDGVSGIALDGAGFIYITGYYSSFSVDFGGGNLANAGGEDIFLAKFGPGGIHSWSKGFGDNSPQWGTCVTTSLDRVFLGAFTNGTVNFGGDDLVSASNDLCFAEFTWDGKHVWSRIYGDSYIQSASALAASQDYTTYMCGHFTGSLDFGGGDLNQGTATSQDAFFVRFDGRPAEPVITSISDIGNDQGRRVRIRFVQSAMDRVESAHPVSRYEIYRRDDPLAAFAPSNASEARSALESPGWVWAGSIPAHGDDAYVTDAATDADSTVDGPHPSVFLVRAASDDHFLYWDSPPDSGSSVDNLAPGVPGALAYSEGVLTWTAPDDPDVDHFTIYGGRAGFDSRSGTIGRTRELSIDVSQHAYDVYRVTATDRSGNESQAAEISLVSETAPPAARLLSLSSHPNPFNPATAISYTLPARGNVRLAIHDARGAQVVVLVDDYADAGEYRATWDGRDNAGRPVSSGVYFARLQHNSGTRSHKLLLLK
ncbi:MAG: SBBP repeat-containing protein [Candidatus Krumholzibacteria bacterium]|nr:SBBP repeat-containing protein [Candidatus Krumholzibacteria bacterium]